jgi:general secretion pathway protein D
MKIKVRYPKRFTIKTIWLISCFVFFSQPFSKQIDLSAFALSEALSTETSLKAGRYVSIDFNNVDIHVFIKFISELTGKNFIIDDRVRGKVTILSPGKISVEEAFKVFQSVLEVHGFASIQAGKIFKIIPIPDARTKNIETKLKADLSSPEDKIVTQLIPLKYADPVQIKRLFAPLISKNSVILAYSPTNTVIVTDVYSNIKRLLRILSAIDISGIGRELSVIPLQHSYATKLVKIVDSIFKVPRKPQNLGMDRGVKLVADERTNSIIILASENDTVKINKLIELLDQKVLQGKETIHVYYLENADAEEMAKVLQKLPIKPGAQQRKGRIPPRSKTLPSTDEIFITPDKATNSLIIRADNDDYRTIKDIIEKLDIPRSMVYIEALIMEVNVDKEFEIGTEWTAFGGKLNDDGTFRGGGGGFGGPGFNKTPKIDPNTGLPKGPLPRGFSMGIFQTIKIGNLVFPNLTAMISAFKKDKDIYILSTPQILTTDNQEAKITVGKNIPYQTKEGTTGGSIETFSTFEYKDIGIMLKVTPHITKNRMVRLAISLENSALESTTDFRPTTLKRTVDTTVIVADKSTVVIGGLIDSIGSSTEYKIPCLGDIPLAGWLFKSLSNEGTKTNLFIFLTPHVVTSPDEARQIFLKKKKRIETIKEGKIKMFLDNTDKVEPKKQN